MMSGPLYGECMTCGARLLIVAIPKHGVSVNRFVAMLSRAQCPYCGEDKRIGLCATDGPHAVTEPRGPTTPRAEEAR